MSTFSVVVCEFASFEIDTGRAMLGWRYQTGKQKHKYCDGCIVQVRERNAFELIKNMAEVSYTCERNSAPLVVLYTNGIPVAYKAKSDAAWWPVTNGWHKDKLNEYMEEQRLRREHK